MCVTVCSVPRAPPPPALTLAMLAMDLERFMDPAESAGAGGGAQPSFTARVSGGMKSCLRETSPPRSSLSPSSPQGPPRCAVGGSVPVRGL